MIRLIALVCATNLFPKEQFCLIGVALASLNSVAADQMESQITAPVLDEQAKETEDVRSEQAASEAL